MRKFVLACVAAVSLTACWTAANAKDHVQNISHSIAGALCAKHGGGEDCEYCDPSHCHLVHCYETGANKGKCTNQVYDAIRAAKSGGVRKPVTQVNGGSNGTAGTPVKHPVHIGSGLQPVVGTGGTNQEGYRGGGMNQGGHHR